MNGPDKLEFALHVARKAHQGKILLLIGPIKKLQRK